MDVLTSETCWAVNWHNKASVIKLVYLYSNVIPIALLLRQWLHERVRMLRCANVACAIALTPVRSTYSSERICSPFACAWSTASCYSMQCGKSPPRWPGAGRAGVLLTSSLNGVWSGIDRQRPTHGRAACSVLPVIPCREVHAGRQRVARVSYVTGKT